MSGTIRATIGITCRLRARASQALLTLSLARSAQPTAHTVLIVGSEQVRAMILETLPHYLTDGAEVEVVHLPVAWDDEA